MLRFSMNRSWTLILALTLCLAFIASHPATVRADGPLLMDGGGGDPGTLGGDPDVPSIPPKQSARRGAVYAGGRLDPMHSAGDGAVTVRVVMWRVLVMARGFRSFYLHF